ncbi:hypothetical protein IB211_00359c [Intestinimonas butyriciproducens]|uniref:Uncharacterized protein n=1 Tax=Intestinimonas butyriciproducens TaxID=1297617 RepID=A0A0S2W0I9_9FIRM|nr:hypothetical protein IB211_00359c [Intestinimonas butyriciproducens]
MAQVSYTFSDSRREITWALPKPPRGFGAPIILWITWAE